MSSFTKRATFTIFCNKLTASDGNRILKGVFMYFNRALAHHLPLFFLSAVPRGTEGKCCACRIEIRLPTVYVGEDVSREVIVCRGCDEGLWDVEVLVIEL
jgi:hypothetical protein